MSKRNELKKHLVTSKSQNFAPIAHAKYQEESMDKFWEIFDNFCLIQRDY